ncbi:hypothetical protein BSNK01_31610 [Bacillaceae bacterium]
MNVRSNKWKIFVEYRIDAHRRSDYLQAVKKLQTKLAEAGATGFRLYAAADQDALYVEEFFLQELEAYQDIKQKRCGDLREADDPAWRAIDPFVQGGREKIHMWAFAEVALE